MTDREKKHALHQGKNRSIPKSNLGKQMSKRFRVCCAEAIEPYDIAKLKLTYVPKLSFRWYIETYFCCSATGSTYSSTIPSGLEVDCSKGKSSDSASQRPLLQTCRLPPDSK